MATNDTLINFSLDIESLGLNPGAIVTEIGICNDYSADELHLYFNVEMQKSLGLAVDKATVRWHQEENSNFVAMVEKCKEEDAGIAHFVDTLRKVEDYFMQFEDHAVAIWMNSPSFDSVLLKVLYEGAGLQLPWSHRAERDLRTLQQLADFGKDHPSYPAKPENAHDALVDAKHQLEIVTMGLTHITAVPF